MIMIMDAFIIVALGVLGACLGSFAGAQVWRLRARQLAQDAVRLKLLSKLKSHNDDETLEYQELRESRSERQRELKYLQPLNRETIQSDRSRCLRCQHTLEWCDLLPVISWVSTGGRCRYCGQPIGRFELMIEAGLGLFFVLSYTLWPISIDNTLSVAAFIVWLIASVPLVVLLAYDAKWFLLPDLPMSLFIGLAGAFASVMIAMDGVSTDRLWSLLGAIVAIGGLYWTLHLVSRGRWVGYGDATLGVGLGLLLGRWELGVLAIFLANGIGSVIVLPALLSGKLDRKAHLPFGPLLITGTMIAFFAGQPVIDWYFGLL